MGQIADRLEDFVKTMEATVLNKWLWIIIGSMCAVVVMPFFIMWTMMMVPAWLSATLTILIILGWGVAGGYKDYLLHKRKSEEAESKGERFNADTYDEYLEKRRRYRIRP